MNWYKKAGIITPDAGLVKWMTLQTKPYIQTLLINKKIKELQQAIIELENPVPSGWNDFNPEKDRKEQHQLKERLKIYMSMPKIKFPSVKDNPKGEIVIDVPRNIIPENIKGLMSEHNKYEMKLILNYKLNAMGWYQEEYGDHDEAVAIAINLMQAMKSKDPYAYMTELLKHELIHNLQHIMSTDNVQYGRPSKNISTPEYEYEDVNKPSRSKKSYESHSLIDDEFYPVLSDKASILTRYKTQYPNLDMTWFKNFIAKDQWLNILKNNATGKYQKAVNELLKIFQS